MYSVFTESKDVDQDDKDNFLDRAKKISTGRSKVLNQESDSCQEPGSCCT